MFYSETEGKRSAPFDMQIVDGLIRNFDASFKLMLKMLND